jgi:hypothetical protein
VEELVVGLPTETFPGFAQVPPEWSGRINRGGEVLSGARTPRGQEFQPRRDIAHPCFILTVRRARDPPGAVRIYAARPIEPVSCCHGHPRDVRPIDTPANDPCQRRSLRLALSRRNQGGAW